MNINIDKWEPGCIFANINPEDPPPRAGFEKSKYRSVVGECNGIMELEDGSFMARDPRKRGFGIPLKIVEECPNDGTCSSKVSGVWYGNAEIYDYVNRQRAWSPWNGRFGIVPRLGQMLGCGDNNETVGWYRSQTRS